MSLLVASPTASNLIVMGSELGSIYPLKVKYSPELIK